DTGPRVPHFGPKGRHLGDTQSGIVGDDDGGGALEHRIQRRDRFAFFRSIHVFLRLAPTFPWNCRLHLPPPELRRRRFRPVPQPTREVPAPVWAQEVRTGKPVPSRLLQATRIKPATRRLQSRTGSPALLREPATRPRYKQKLLHLLEKSRRFTK